MFLLYLLVVLLGLTEQSMYREGNRVNEVAVWYLCCITKHRSGIFRYFGFENIREADAALFRTAVQDFFDPGATDEQKMEIIRRLYRTFRGGEYDQEVFELDGVRRVSPTVQRSKYITILDAMENVFVLSNRYQLYDLAVCYGLMDNDLSWKSVEEIHIQDIAPRDVSMSEAYCLFGKRLMHVFLGIQKEIQDYMASDLAIEYLSEELRGVGLSGSSRSYISCLLNLDKKETDPELIDKNLVPKIVLKIFVFEAIRHFKGPHARDEKMLGLLGGSEMKYSVVLTVVKTALDTFEGNSRRREKRHCCF